MADWPPSDVTYDYPEFTRTIVREGPNTLVARFIDGTVETRVKNAKVWRRFFEHWAVSRDDMRLMLLHYDVYGLTKTFTMRALDPMSGDSYATELAQVRYVNPPATIQIGPKWFEIDYEFIEVEL